ncbi:RCC1 repeat-containing protein [Sphaceloma murrayae]|uniref:RCC1 repeat-containing protein n=1 Tax=Sphaceloma murrayae TaxID=2082308 RepID=A0A2K1QFG1_9PEZI|nr:RCC1 repeat-containing protein [Sphaceloma murrayae]
MRLFALGSNGAGQLGLGHTQDISTPVEVAIPDQLKRQKIKSIASGGNHTVILTEDGDVWATGAHRGSQDSVSETESSRLIPIFSDVQHVAALWSATVLVHNDQRISTFGYGTKGELGHGPALIETHAPAKILDFPPVDVSIVDISASMGHIVVVLSSGDAYGWGQGRQGQLGEPHQTTWTPRKIDGAPFPIVKAACGKDFTCFFSSPAQGNVFLLGHNKIDRFGLKVAMPESFSPWTQVAASWGSVYVLLDDGSLSGFGRDDRGQLGPNELLPKLSGISAGSEHVLALNTNGKTLTWGWGEHGNCGEPVDNQKDVKGRFNVLEVPSEATFVHAGCATSFIVVDDG